MKWRVWRIVWYLVDVACCIIVFYPVSGVVHHLENMLGDEEKDREELGLESNSISIEDGDEGSSSNAMAYVKLFKNFYSSVIVWIYATRVGIYLLAFVLPYQWLFVSTLFHEVVDLIFFFFVGRMLYYTCIVNSSSRSSRGKYQKLKTEEDDDDMIEMVDSSSSSKKHPFSRSDESFLPEEDEEMYDSETMKRTSLSSILSPTPPSSSSNSSSKSNLHAL